ncbi:hypothetical protein CJU89_5376 [Yarrowia sp. B02]|nr:hypothetical protein CJU89_5376 [Yarrowia sp. B02]
MTENFPDSTPSCWATEEEAVAWLYSPYLHELVIRNDYFVTKRVVYTHGVVQDIQSGTMAGFGCYFGQSNECNFSGPLVGMRQTKARASYAAILQALKIIYYRRENYRWQIRSTSAGVPRLISQGCMPAPRTPASSGDNSAPEEERDLLEEILEMLERMKMVEIRFMLDINTYESQATAIGAVEKLAQGGIYEPVFYLPEGN